MQKKSTKKCIKINFSQVIQKFLLNLIIKKNIDSRTGKNLSNIIDSVPADVGNFEVLRYNNNEGFRTKIKAMKQIKFLNMIDRKRK